MFAVTGGYHRYFSHKTYETSRWFQFILAFLAETSAQQGVIWWANHHRRHHKYSDTADDVHSPRHHGFWYSHVGWIFTPEYLSKDYDMVPDWEKFPELRWLNNYHYVPTITVAIISWLIGGWSGVVLGFCCSTVAVYHTTFFINSLAHLWGKQRYNTADDSRNNWWLALISLGEGWHNNHHHWAVSARQGFRWWEIDITYYVLRILAALGVIWNIKEPPLNVVTSIAPLSSKVVKRSQELLTFYGCQVAEERMQLIKLRNEILAMEGQSEKLITLPVDQMANHLTLLRAILKNKIVLTEKLPPKFMTMIKNKLHHATALLENAALALRSYDSLQQAISVMDAAIFSLQSMEDCRE